jgi:hypothetical protein
MGQVDRIDESAAVTVGCAAVASSAGGAAAAGDASIALYC